MKSIRSQGQGHGQGHSENTGQGQGQVKNTDQQIYTMLLLVTFSYLILTTPVYIMLLYINLVDHFQSPYHYAAYILFAQVGQQTFYTNFGINFFFMFYRVKKFRKDLIALFIRRSSKMYSSEVNR